VGRRGFEKMISGSQLTKDLLEIIMGNVTCRIDGEREEKNYPSGKDAAAELIGPASGYRKYNITSISVEEGNIVLKLEIAEKVIPNDLNAEWVKEHVERFGEEPGFF
jgi:hypothetical protein